MLDHCAGLCSAQTDPGTGVWHHQIGARIPSIFVARARQGARRVEPCDHGLEHQTDVRPQPLSLSKIKSEHSDGVIRREWVSGECAQRSLHVRRPRRRANGTEQDRSRQSVDQPASGADAAIEKADQLLLDMLSLNMFCWGMLQMCLPRRGGRRHHRSTSPKTISSEPKIALTSASIDLRQRKSIAARCAKPGARILQRYGFSVPSDTR
jgi:hypothetical protein